jgi:hypothetical protein
MEDFIIPLNFKKVVCGSSTDNRLRGVEFYDKQGKKLLTAGTISNPVETILEDDERIVGVASHYASYGNHYDF